MRTRRFHYRRDQFGRQKNPQVALANFKEAKALGLTPYRTWAHANRAYRKKLRKNKLAKLARRKNRR